MTSVTPLLLFVVKPAFATCVLRQAATPTGARVEVQAQTEPLPCRTMSFESSGPALSARAWILTAEGRKQRLPKDHVVVDAWGLQVGAPELVEGGTLVIDLTVPGDDLTVTVGPRAPVAHAAQTHVTRTILLDAKHPGWGFADPKLGRTRTEVHWVDPDGARSVELPGARAQDVVHVDPGSFTLSVPEADVSVTTSPGITTTRDNGAWRFDAPSGGEVRYCVHATGADRVISDTAAYVEGTDYYFTAASLPEPAVPVSMMAVTGRRTRLDALFALVQDLRDGALPGRDPLRPRQLNRAWRSGWATPIERGLILQRMLGQEHVDVDWVLTGSAVDLETLTGFEALLVHARLDGEELWLDPGCTNCDVGELDPRWMGQPGIGQATGGRTFVLPRQPGRLVRTLALVGDRFHATFVAEGAAALWLRQALEDRAPDARPARAAELLGMPGATLQRFDGLGTPGGALTIELTGASSPKDPFPPGQTPWEGGWSDAAAEAR